jgi:protein-L-isoaspartate(D-aspartate) O-methyltransferase
MIDVQSARRQMIEQQVRAWDVLDLRVLAAMERVPREAFVPADYRDLAFADMNVPLGEGQSMLAPKVEGRILQALAVTPADRVLEVGTGSGYMTALLASLAAHVYTVDIVPEFTEAAATKLRSHGIHNVTVETGDAARGWDKHSPYDVIVVTGSLPVLPPAFQNSLQPGGRLFVVVGEPPIMEARLVTCISRGVFNSMDVFETCISPLRNALQPERFVF